MAKAEPLVQALCEVLVDCYRDNRRVRTGQHYNYVGSREALDALTQPHTISTPGRVRRYPAQLRVVGEVTEHKPVPLPKGRGKNAGTVPKPPPPVPGANATRIERLRWACSQLDHGEDAHWHVLDDGKQIPNLEFLTPMVATVEDGAPVTMDEVKVAMPDIVREQPKS